MAQFVPIQIHRSPNIAAPAVSSLFPEGSLAYSYDQANSGAYAKLFFSALDSDDSPITHVIGGKYYTTIVDNATPFNIPNTLALRDSNGGISANITGYANYLNPGFDLSVSGNVSGNVFINGLTNPILDIELEDTGVADGVYGGPNQIPVFTVDSYGRLTQAANVNLSTEIGIAGDAGNVTLETGQMLRILGNVSSSISTEATAPNVITISYSGVNEVAGTANQINADFDPDTQITTVSIPDNFVAPGNATIIGNLTVKGKTTTVESITVETDDSLIKLANNNILSDVLDSGFYSQYNDGSSVKYAGLVRKATDKLYHLLEGIVSDPSSNVVSGGNVATLVSNLEGGTVSNLSAPIAVVDGGLGITSITANTVIIGDGTNPVKLVSGTDGQILQYVNGEPVFQFIDGGIY